MDDYTKRKIAELKQATTDEDMETIIDAIYNDGFSDGRADAENDQNRDDIRQGRVEV